MAGIMLSTFANNKLLHKLNFNQGILHGASVYFDTAGAEPTPYLYASYNNGLKHGEWLFRDASKMIRCEFDNGVRNGKYENFNRMRTLGPHALLAMLLHCKAFGEDTCLTKK